MDLLISYIFLNIPEAIIYSLATIYLLNIKCSRFDKIFATFYTSLVMFLFGNIFPENSIKVVLILGSLPIIYKAYFKYSISYNKYLITLFVLFIGFALLELLIFSVLFAVFGDTIRVIMDNPKMLIISSLPVRVLEFIILYLLYRRYKTNV